jgi:thiol-disulfide isomerase/thioredoxin
MTEQAALAVAAKPAARSAGAVLRRQCACGNHSVAGEECEECRGKKKGQLQRSAVNAGPRHAPPVVHEVLRSPGQPLDAATRAFLEPRFGQDFGGVRVHTDARADESARAVGAVAYTVGRHIAFSGTSYAPRTRAGRSLLAHELAHVVQQGAQEAGDPLAIGPREAPEEREAETAASQLRASANGRRGSVASPGMLRRQAQAQAQAGAGAATEERSEPSEAHTAACLQPVRGEEIQSLLESRVVTVVEYGAEWCGPCRGLKADLDRMCRELRATRSPVRVRFYTVDIEDPRNAEASRSVQRFIPQLSLYVGTTRRRHWEERPEPGELRAAINEQIQYTSQSGAARGARTGLLAGLGIGGGAGLAVGLGLALAGVLTGGLGLLAIAGLAAAGAAVGLGLGAGVGAAIGALTDKRERAAGARIGFNEAETLIRRRYGRFLPTAAGPLNNALIRPVTQVQLQALHRCRHPQETGDLSRLTGWTDTGPPPSTPIASAEDEPVCSTGQRLEHATAQQPVVYYARDKPDLSVLVHEGIHAYAHPNFVEQVRNYINEGATEYLSVQLLDQIGVASQSGYGDNVAQVRRLVGVVGEEALLTAYFRGDFSRANAVLGPCGIERWAQLLTMNLGESSEAAEVLQNRNRDYCGSVRVFPTAPQQGSETTGSPR